jgi:DNA gyrase inhibitor GyrI
MESKRSARIANLQRENLTQDVRFNSVTVTAGGWKSMNELDVRIVRLEPIRVAGALGFGESPELIAWSKILSWAESKGLINDDVRFFGFNNPNPSPGSPNYGYEQWITVGADVKSEGEIEVKEYPGGLYAVARCKGLQNITSIWKELASWLENSSYKLGQHQWLEESMTPLKSVAEFEKLSPDEFVLDLYCPVAEES